MRSDVTMLLRAAFACTLICVAVWGQAISTSQIKGTVQDATRLPVPDASVKLIQTATGAARTVATGQDGGYLFSELTVGPYQLEVTKPGFSRYVQSGIVLQVDSNPAIDVSLQVGEVTEQILVDAGASMVETQSTGVGQVIDQQSVTELPLNGRQVTDLLYLTGGVTQGRAFRASYPSTTTPSVAGGGIGTVAYWLDGGTHNDPLSNQNLPLPFPDALQEFKVETSSLPAQYGAHSAGSVNVVTKSGGNAFHGNAFEFVRNYVFNARNTYAAARDNLKRNQFGGTLGGPIRKNKIFFFLGWQETSTHASNPTSTFIPSAAMLAGDFTAAAACSGVSQLPASLGFVNNRINPARFSPIILRLESLLPVPTDPCGLYKYLTPASYTEHQGLVKIDYHPSDRNTFFGRYFVTHFEQPPGDPKQGLIIGAIDGTSASVMNVTLGDTFVITPRTVNSLRVTENRTSNTSILNSTVNLSDLGVQNIYALPQPKFPKFLSNIVIGNGPQGFLSSVPASLPFQTFDFSDDLSITRGAHQLSFGLDFMNLRAFSIFSLASNGGVTFDGSRGGLPLSDFLLGLPSRYDQSPPVYSDQRQNLFSLYAQDTWKVTRRLTVSAGLRWDPFFGHTNPYGQVVNISIPNLISNTHSTVFPTAPAGFLFQGDAGGPSNNKYTKNALLKFSPRAGVVWDPRGDGRMTIRAGFGIFYDFPSFAFDPSGFGEPYGGTVTLYNFDLSNPWSAFPGGNPFPQHVGTGKNSQFQPYALVFSYPQDIKPTYVMQYNLSLQRQIGANWLLSASYLGNQQRHLWISNEVNPGIPGPGFCGFPCSGSVNQSRLFNRYPDGKYYGETVVLDEGGTGSYNGLILSAQHRFARRFTSSTNFTWSHCISDNYSLALGFNLVSDMIPNNRRADRGNCPSADTRLVFTQSLVLDSPRYSNRTAQIIAGDWRLSFSAIMQSGSDLPSPTLIVDQAGDGNGFTQRPQQILKDPYCHPQRKDCWLNPSAFGNVFAGSPAPGTFGNLGNNSLLGPGSIVMNMALSRIFPIREHQQLEIRGEAFNLPNLVNLYPPQGVRIAPNFGQTVATSTGGQGALAQTINDPRILQFAVKYIF